MEAKDTVVEVRPHSESIWCPHCGEEFGIEGKVECERETQAEISFKAGIREVVEWIERISKAGQPSKFIPSSEWQAKLREWRIEC